MAQFLTFSAANPADLEEILELHACAYPDARTFAERKAGLTQSLLGNLENLVLARKGTALVAHAFLFDLKVHAWSDVWSIGGVASVAVAPEFRSTGIAGALLEHVHELSRARDHLGTLLYAFRDAFYARLGYAALSPFLALDFAPESLPSATFEARRVQAADVPMLIKLYAACASQGIGALVRGEAQWTRRLLHERRHTYLLGDEAYLSFRYEQHEAHAQTTLAVESWGAKTPRARTALQGFLAAQRDQVSRVTLPCAVNDPFPLALVDADRRRHGTAALEHPFGTLAAGPMFRPHAIEALLALRPPQTPMTLALPDRTLRVNAGEIALAPSAEQADIRFAHEGDLARALMGSASLSDLAQLERAFLRKPTEPWPTHQRYFSFDPF
jgi:predicted N-acetyltransferase YhbS